MRIYVSQQPFLLCSLIFLRVGGIAKKGSAVSKVSQVSGACFKDLNVHVTLRYSKKKKKKKKKKTDRQGRSDILVFTSSLSKSICLVSLLSDYIRKI